MPAFAAFSLSCLLSRFVVIALVLLAPMPLLAAAGDLDCTFGDAGTVEINLGILGTYDAAQQSDGKIIAMGGANGSLQLSRFLADGDLDLTFGTDGSTTFALAGSFAYALAIDSLGRFVVAGEIANGGDSEVWVARFTPAGAVDTSFGGGDGWIGFDWTTATTTAGVDSGDAITVDSSDRPVVGGWTDANGSSHMMGVARLTTDGVLDATFGGGGIALAGSPDDHDDELRSLKVDGNGNIVAIGTSTVNLQTPRDTIMARWTDTGILDSGFSDDGVLVLDLAAGGGGDLGFDLDFDSSDRILALSSGSRPFVARLQPDGTLDPTFDGDGLVQQTFIGTNSQVTSLLVQADDKPLVIGWPRVGSSFHLAVMRFTTSGALDTSWGIDGVVTTGISASQVARAAFLKPDQRLVVAGSSGSTFVMARYLTDGSTGSTATTITSDLPDPSMVGTNVTVGVSVSAINDDLPPSGTVTVGDGVDSCSLGLTPDGAASASGSCDLALTTVGSRTINATYQSDSFLCPSSDTEPHLVVLEIVSTTTTSIISDVPDPSVIGQAVTVGYRVAANGVGAGSPTGTVTVTDGVDSCVGSIADGSCSLALTTAGARSLIASYSGDALFSSSVSVPEPHQVDAAATTTSIISDLPDPSVVGQAVSVTFEVAVVAPGVGSPTGTVTVTDGVDSCVGSIADGSCSLALTTAGARSLTASYSGDALFSSSVSVPEPHQVDAAATTTSIISDLPDPSVVGQAVPVTFEVAVVAPGAGSPTGTVTVTDGVDSCVGSIADGSCSLALTTAGARSLTASYSGDALFSSSVSVPEPHQVDDAATTTSIISDLPDPSVVGQAVQVTFEVAVVAPGAGSPTGTVTVTDGVDSCAASIAAGSCALTLATEGTRLLTAIYSGDSSLGSSTSPTESHQVSLALTKTTLLSHTPDPSVFGQTVTMVFSVESMFPGTPSGTVTVSDGVDACTAAVADGSCAMEFSTVGLRSLTATYGGDGLFSGSSDTVDHTVQEASTETTILSMEPNPVDVGATVMVTFTVDALLPAPGEGAATQPTGLVLVSDGEGNGCSAPVSDAGCILVATTAGRFTITASYLGDGSYAPSQAIADEELVVLGVPVVEVPTLGGLGLMLLSLVLAVAAISMLRGGGALPTAQ